MSDSSRLDVLTPEHIKALRRWLDKRPEAPRWIGPTWAVDHLRAHGYFKVGCGECLRAWRTMSRL